MVDVHLAADKEMLGRQAAALGAQAIRDALARHGEATIIVATGASQFELLQALVAAEGIDWSKVTAFHLDEYVGLSEAHPASFRRYLRERFVAPLNGAVSFIPVDGEGDPQAESLPGESDVLFTNISKLKLSYFDARDGEWKDSWSTQGVEGSANRLPDRVKIEMTFPDDKGKDVTLSTQAKPHLREMLNFVAN